ncbi:MAG: alkaline phosphatase PhoX [Candidatus Limnocylindrales bacterium]
MDQQHDLRRRSKRRSIAAVAALGALVIAVSPVAGAGPSVATGPSTSTSPYVLPVAEDVKITSLLTVGDSKAAGNGYEMVGIPDGLGLTREDGRLVLFMNHELRDAPGQVQGIVRRHGQPGAFVSRLVIDPTTLKVKNGSDLIDPGVKYWDYPNGDYVTTDSRWADLAAQQLSFGRFCSGTLTDPGVLFNERSGRGYRGQLWFGNEEDGDNGRTFGVTTDGAAAALPRLGLFQWENTIPAENRSDTTLVMGQEDGPGDGSQLWAYVGKKQRLGTPIARAGLTKGLDYVFDAANATVTNDAQWRTTYPKGVPGEVKLVNIPWSITGAAQNGLAKEQGLNLNRVEDGFFDPNSPNDFYFLTTEGGEKTGTGLDARDGGGLWRLTFKNIEKPSQGATLTLLLDGSESLPGTEPKLNKPDNMTLDTHGNLLIQEDPGGNNHLARIVAYRLDDGALGVVARFDTALFGPGATDDPNRLTIDEESSGIIDAERLLGKGMFVFDAQVHTAKGLPVGTGPNTVQEYVERGQLLVMKVKSWSDIYED